jgi:Ferritin-like
MLMITAKPRIHSLKDLRNHLQYAIGLELTTVPAYLCALYSIKPGANSAARETIQSVVLEEMLHMALAANVLNAIGGTPSPGPVGRGASPVPAYPTDVPYIEGIPKIQLRAFSPEAVQDFINIEHPAGQDSSNSGKKYASIGAFYEAITGGLQDEKLCPQELFEKAHHERGDFQVSGADYYGGAGTLIEVTDRDSAVVALSLIAKEGEGLPAKDLNKSAGQDLISATHTAARRATLGAFLDDAGELVIDDQGVVDADVLPYGWKLYSHYARFMEILHGQRYFPDQKVKEKPRGDFLPTDWHAVRPMIANPKAKNYRDYPSAYESMIACNRTYTKLVDTTYRSFNGESDGLRDAVGLMYKLKYQAEALFNTPSPLPFEQGHTLGPAFEYLHDQSDPVR